MKDGRFETQAEIYQALLDGKKIILNEENSYIRGRHVFINKEGIICYDDGEICYLNFLNPRHWLLYEEPRTTEDRLEDIELAIKEIKSFLDM